jgi:hypothetical protein
MSKSFLKALAGALTLAVIITILAPAAQASTMRENAIEIMMGSEQAFSDVPNTSANFAAVQDLSERDVIKGYADGTFKPDNNVNRAELVKMVVGMMLGEPDATDITKYKNCFPDVKDEWFASYICLAKEQGWVDGYPDGTFKPGNSVNRVEAIKIALNIMIAKDYWPDPTDAELALPMPKDADMNAWYSSFLRFAIVKELLDGQHVTGDETAFFYKPAEPMTRKEVAEMIFRTSLYMGERIEYADLIADVACFIMANPDLSDEEAQTKWSSESLEPRGYTLDDANKLTLKYTDDSVLKDLTVDLTQYTCGDKTKVDMTKWEGLRAFGR